MIIIVSTRVSRCLQDAEEMLKIAISISETLENKVSNKSVSLSVSLLRSFTCLKVMLWLLALVLLFVSIFIWIGWLSEGRARKQDSVSAQVQTNIHLI